MTIVLILFLSAAVLLWLSVFGYLLALGSVAIGRRRQARAVTEWPEVAVVVPTLDEEALVRGKLDDLARTDYPPERLTVIVADGGSTDRTRAFVEQRIARGDRIRLVRVDGARCKAEQLNRALAEVEQDHVVMTDVDARLAPSCVRELVRQLVADPATAVVGAAVRPASGLLEERIYWWFLNSLWWLEGEVLSAGVVAGVCYAFKRRLVGPFAADVRGDDVHLAFAAAARGLRVRLCPAAEATEVRVPQTIRELVRFRRRRGGVYMAELLRDGDRTPGALGHRVARHVRLWHFLVTPHLGAALGLLAGVLLWSPHWPWLLLTAGAFTVPAAGALLASATLAAEGLHRLAPAAARLCAAVWLALLTLERPPPPHAASGEAA